MKHGREDKEFGKRVVAVVAGAGLFGMGVLAVQHDYFVVGMILLAVGCGVFAAGWAESPDDLKGGPV